MPAATAKPGSWFQYANTVWEPGQAKPDWLTPGQEKGWMPGSSITQMTAARGTPEYAAEQAQKNDAQLALNKTNHAKAQADQLAAWKAKRGIATLQETPMATTPAPLGQGFASAMSPWQPRPFTSPFAQAAGAPKPTVGPGGAPMPPALGSAPGVLDASGGGPSGPGIGMKPPGMQPLPTWGGGVTGVKPGGGTPELVGPRTGPPSGPPPAPPPPPDGGGISPRPISSAAQHANENRARTQANQDAARQKKADYNTAKDAAKAQGTTLAAQHVAERKAAAAAKKAGKGVSLGTGATAY